MRRREIGIIVPDRKIVGSVIKVFEADWNPRQLPAKEPAVEPPDVTVGQRGQKGRKEYRQRSSSRWTSGRKSHEGSDAERIPRLTLIIRNYKARSGTRSETPSRKQFRR